MKKNILVITLLLALIIICSCKKKDETFTKFPTPDWAVDTSGKYPLSMTAVVQVPDTLKPYLQPQDKLGAFINDECRGIGVLVNINNTSAYYVLIHGTASEQEKVSFKYYSTATAYIYTANDVVDFTVDGNYGTADAPEILDMHPTK